MQNIFIIPGPTGTYLFFFLIIILLLLLFILYLLHYILTLLLMRCFFCVERVYLFLKFEKKYKKISGILFA